MIPGGFGSSYGGLAGFAEAELEPAPVAAPMYGARTFNVRTFGRMPTEPLGLSAILPYGQTNCVIPEHVIGGLHSIFMEQYRWSCRANRATCLLGATALLKGRNHGMPQRCSCGFWAYTSGEAALPGARDALWAVIQGWGRIVVGPKGFRSMFARIVAATFPVILTDEGDMPMRWSGANRYPERVEHVTDPEQLAAAMRVAYPSVDWCESVAEMYAKYPLSKLDPRMFSDEAAS